MDGIKIVHIVKKNTVEVFCEFLHIKSKDLLIRSGILVYFWDTENECWSNDKYRFIEILDGECFRESERLKIIYPDKEMVVKMLSNSGNRQWSKLKYDISQTPDNYRELNDNILFSNYEIKKEDYASKKLPYSLSNGSIDAYNEIMGVLYNPEERQKIEWAIGSIFVGDSKIIQKAIVLYGSGGTGKGTILKIIEQLFEGYWISFSAKGLGSSTDQFSTAPFVSNALVALDYDSDLSKINTNIILNKIISHEIIYVNEKHIAAFQTVPKAFLFMASNQPVKITDSRSGLLRRIIDVSPSTRLIPKQRYDLLLHQIRFELGSIAQHCIDVYKLLGRNYYNNYNPTSMMYKTNLFINFLNDNFEEFNNPNGITANRAFDLFKQYKVETDSTKILPRHVFIDELGNYFREFHNKYWDGTKQIRSLFRGFKSELFDVIVSNNRVETDYLNNMISLTEYHSIFDRACSEVLAQYATEAGIPEKKWSDVTTKLKDIDTNKVHYVLLDQNHIVIDFDLKNDGGEKSLEKNLEEASKWPSTYTEVSKSGQGLHLHYIYDGDPLELSRVYSDGVEIKVFTGNSSLRRKLTLCNNKEIAHISSGLPLKEGKVKMINISTIKSEKGLRDLILRNLRKEIHPGTKPSIDFIYKILKDAYDSGMKYDLTNMRSQVLAFANKSTNHAAYCMKLVNTMKFQSEEETFTKPIEEDPNDKLIFFDCEVFPNLLVVCWKVQGEGKDVIKWINPTPDQIEYLFGMKLVGFNNRRYDNHIIYARYLGYTTEEIHGLSKKLIANPPHGHFREAYNVSYTDIWDFSAEKDGLKQCEIDMGIHHVELGLPWDEPVAEELWSKVVDYCANDVLATEVVFNARKGDYSARQILAVLSGLSINHSTNQHTTKIVFGDNKHPELRYVDLTETFPDYKCIINANNVVENWYRDTNVGKGGYNFSIPGIYENVAVLDISNMHPASIIAMNLFGKYTETYSNLVEARRAIKHNDLETARKLLGEKAAPYLQDINQAKNLSQALKIAQNSVYGLTFAKHDNPFKDTRNVNNIVAVRGALLIRELQYQVENQDFVIVHIRTDSLKIPNASKDILDFVMDFAKQYGYIFEFEDTYEKMCLTTTSDLIAKVRGTKDKPSYWKAVGLYFKRPFVFKTLFSKEEVTFDDLGETRAVKAPTSMYLDFNEDLPDGEHNYAFIGRVGCFCPVKEGCGGGVLLRHIKDDKYDAVNNTKGWRWKEKELIEQLGLQDEVDMEYYHHEIDEVKQKIAQFGDVEEFIS